MNLPLAARTAALLALVDAHRERRCDEILAPARAEAAALLQAARAEAHRRVRATLAEERARHRATLAAARARLATARRLAAQRRAVEALAQAHAALRAELARRWAAPETRRAWIDAAMARARAMLPADAATAWTIEAANGLESISAAAGTTPVTLHQVAALGPGLRIRCGANVLDATLDGLLADAADLDARLLRALALEDASGGPGDAASGAAAAEAATARDGAP